jgi:hypothetical protein
VVDGNTPTDGSDGNVRTYTSGGVSVKATINLASCQDVTGIKLGYAGTAPSVTPGETYVFEKTYVVMATDPNPLVSTATAYGHPPGNLPVVSKTSTWSVQLLGSAPARPTVRRDELLTFAATQWASRAPDDAVDWAAKVEEETLRNRLLKDIFTEWGDRDPLQAATAAVKSMPEGREQNDTVVGIVQRWAQTEPKTAGAWVAAFPDGDLRETAGRELVTIWADQAVEEAGQWLDALPGGGFRDTAVSAYVDKILPMVPDTAAVWAMQIGDPVRRAEVLERVGTEWLESDAAAARVWIANSALSPEAKARLLTPPKSTVPGAEPAAAAGSPSRSQGVGKAAGS